MRSWIAAARSGGAEWLKEFKSIFAGSAFGVSFVLKVWARDPPMFPPVFNFVTRKIA
jgi:hypothetical protein